MDPAEERTTEVEQAIAELSRLMLSEGTMQSAMERMADLAVASIPHCDTCSVSSVDGGRVTTTVSTDAVAERVDAHQYQSDEGPCLNAIRTGVETRIGSMVDDTRWPRFRQLGADEGIRSCYSLPLLAGSETLGALNLYSLGDSFGQPDEQAGRAFAEQAAVTLANSRAYQRVRDLVDSLSLALESRDVIGQAKGIIMERERCTAEQAFDILRSVSQSRHIKLRDLAQRVVDTGTWSDLEP
ncbi:MAG TPA: GAF and ANTAR domain-containing protein [Acidimicrobiales bacterium]|nr:GAF and ANTAR domain-containing protein [Acidimicrobiales bacterium]